MDKTRFNLAYLFVAMLGVTLIHDLVVRYRAVAPIPYSEFKRQLQDNNVKEVVVAANEAALMATRYAMVPKLGQVAYEQEAPGFLGPKPAGWVERAYSEETAREIDCAVREIVDAAFRRASGILDRNREILEEGSRLLLEKETLDEKELERIFGKGLVPS